MVGLRASDANVGSQARRVPLPPEAAAACAATGSLMESQADDLFNAKENAQSGAMVTALVPAEVRQALQETTAALGKADTLEAEIATGGSEVLLDTSAVKSFGRASHLLKPGETPVICSTVACEAAAKDYSTAGLPEVPDSVSATLRARVAQQLRAFRAKAQGFDNDVAPARMNFDERQQRDDRSDGPRTRRTANLLGIGRS